MKIEKSRYIKIFILNLKLWKKKSIKQEKWEYKKWKKTKNNRLQ